MRMNLRRLREVQNLKLKDLARYANINVERLRAIEQYKELPTYFELCHILKGTNHYFDETYQIIWHDIEDHYIPQNYNEYHTIQENVNHYDNLIEENERNNYYDK